MVTESLDIEFLERASPCAASRKWFIGRVEWDRDWRLVLIEPWPSTRARTGWRGGKSDYAQCRATVEWLKAWWSESGVGVRFMSWKISVEALSHLHESVGFVQCLKVQTLQSSPQQLSQLLNRSPLNKPATLHATKLNYNSIQQRIV